ncbi:Hypothetical protein, conserved [Brucella melitensis ATCC 23457]|uniref:Uncharacterized protein n=1 Tax=Brucella melitensis biotype 2 (strain ATCC 23457) TaxID=546272 RepID=C0RGU4_BRUMB|nr:Hypothetical protein, conserved [Brucella melitensis ATCC 23457]
MRARLMGIAVRKAIFRFLLEMLERLLF